MKKVFMFIIFSFFVLFEIMAVEIRSFRIYTSVFNNPVQLNNVINLFYDENSNLIIIFPNYARRDSVFVITKNYELYATKYEMVQNYGFHNNWENNGISYELLNGATIQLKEYVPSFISKENRIYYRYNDYSPNRYFMYISDSNENIIFDFNKWRLSYKEFYPTTYYNGLSEKKNYTKEGQDLLLNNNPAFTEYSRHAALNRKQNRFAVVFDKYNGKTGALVIFEILYDAACNDDKVRVRAEPNLDCETVTYLNKNDAVKIKDQSDRKFEIDGEKWYWYQVETADGKTGWVYGKYLDIEKE